jgi:uncharacterized protein (TIGR03437 family)
MYLGDLSHTSYTRDVQLNNRNAAQIQALWKTSLGSTLSTGVTVSDGSLYFGAWDGNFYSVNAATGQVAWKQYLGVSPDPLDPVCQPGIGISGQAVVSGGKVYVPGGDSAIYALDASTGAILWRTPLADPQSGSQLWASLMLSGNALYAGIASLGDCPLVRGGLARISLDKPDAPLIRYFVPDGSVGAGLWTTPAIDETTQMIYVTTGNADAQDPSTGDWGSAMLALEAATLSVKGSFFLPIVPGDVDVDFGSSPTLFQTPDGSQLAAATGKDGVMYVVHRPGMGSAWKVKVATDCIAPELGCGSISTPAFDGRTIFVGAGQSDQAGAAPGTVYAVDPASRSVVWTYPAKGVVLAPVTVSPTLVLAPTADGLAILDSNTGAELWNDATHQPMYGQAAFANGTIYATYVNGDLIAWGLPSSGPSILVSAPSAMSFSYTGGGASPAPQSIDLFSTGASLDFAVSSDSPWLSVNVPAGSTPANLAVNVDTSGLQPGVYSGNIVLQPGGGTPVQVPVKLTANPAPPTLTTSNVVSAASFQPGPLAPGSLFTIAASNLAAQTTSVTSAPWPDSVSGISIEINGVPAPLLYISPQQINAQIPYETASGAASLVLQSNDVSSAPVSIQVADAAPGIFLIGATRAAAENQDYSINTLDNPAAPGDVAVIYFTGQGLGDYPVLSGAAAPFQTLVNSLVPPSATIGDQPAEVLYAGLTPGFVGLSQANLRIPGLAPGDYPVVLTIGGVSSNSAVISVGSAH